MDLHSLSNIISFFLFIAIFYAVIIHIWKKKSQPFKSNENLPPGPFKLPIIGNIHNLVGSLPHRILRDLAKKHGHVMHLKLGEVSAIVVSSPRIAEEILKTHDLSLANRPQILAAKIINYDCTDIAFCQYGDYWRQMRKICILELLSRKNVQSFSLLRKEELSRVVDFIIRSRKINFSHTISSYTSSMVFRAAFGKTSSSSREKFVRVIEETVTLAGSFDILDLFPSYKILHGLTKMHQKLVNLHNEVDQILEEIINYHIDHKRETTTTTTTNGGDEEDLVDVLLRVQQSGELKFPLTKSNIKAVLIDMFSGGTETSSTVVEWVMSELMKNRRVMIKAQTEIRKAFKGKKTIDEGDIHVLTYLKLVIQETLRLHPPLPLLIPRECRKDCEIDGYNIPIKTRVLINAWAIGRDSKYWDDPETFEPERFEKNPIDFSGNHFQFIPFGAGRRICPGMSFGLANVEYPLALLLYHFNWELPDGMESHDLDMAETAGITAGRKNELYLVATLYDISTD